MMYVVAPTMEWAKQWWRQWCKEHNHHPLQKDGFVKLYSAHSPEYLNGIRLKKDDMILRVGQSHWPDKTLAEVIQTIRRLEVAREQR